MKHSINIALLAAVFIGMICLSARSEKNGREAAMGLSPALSVLERDLGKAIKKGDLVAVLDFIGPDGRTMPLCYYLAESLSVGLTREGGRRMIERRKINQVIIEKNLISGEISEPDAIEKIGQALGADWIVTGTIREAGESVRIEASIMDVSSGQKAGQSSALVYKSEVQSLMVSSPRPEPVNEASLPIPGGGELVIRVSFAAEVTDAADGNISRIIELTPGAVLHSGDRMKIRFSANRPCYVYVIQIGSTGSAGVLFPGQGEAASNYIQAGMEYALPPGTGWYTLDDHLGRESLYFLAAKEPIKDLSRLIGGLAKEDADKSALSNSISTELNKIFDTRAPGRAKPPIDVTGTAGYTERSIGGISQGPPLSLSGSSGKGRINPTIIKGDNIVARHVEFEHR